MQNTLFEKSWALNYKALYSVDVILSLTSF